MNELRFTVDWLGAPSPKDPEAATFGALEISTGDAILTHVEDLLARTTRNSVRVSLNLLGHWFADNWWRLRWEPAPHGSPRDAWRLSHEVSAAGGGYVWPKMQIVSDGEIISVVTDPTAAGHTIRYLNHVEANCQATSYERAIDSLMEQIVSRHHNVGQVDARLDDTWKAVCEERAERASSNFRRREALIGLDPDELDSGLLESLFGDGAWMGSNAFDETLAGTTTIDRARATIDSLEALRKEKP